MTSGATIMEIERHTRWLAEYAEGCREHLPQIADSLHPDDLLEVEEMRRGLAAAVNLLGLARTEEQEEADAQEGTVWGDARAWADLTAQEQVKRNAAFRGLTSPERREDPWKALAEVVASLAAGGAEAEGSAQDVREGLAELKVWLTWVRDLLRVGWATEALRRLRIVVRELAAEADDRAAPVASA